MSSGRTNGNVPAGTGTGAGADIVRTNTKLLLVIFLVFLAGTWLWFGWVYFQASQDVRADYEPVDLRGAGQAEAPGAKGSHLKIRGIPVNEARVVHKTNGRQDYFLVPMVGADWRPGRAIRYVIQVDSRGSGEPYIPGVSTGDATGREIELFARRIAGGIPVAARGAFEKGGIAGADHAVLIHPVPIAAGRPMMADTLTELVVAAIISVTILIMFPVAYVSQKRKIARMTRSPA